MDFDLLKKLLPGECIEYTTKQGVRSSDGRGPNQHRPYTIQRNVMADVLASCSVRLGQTLVLCSLQPPESGQGSVVREDVQIQLQMARDATTQQVRRDLLQDQEAQIKAFIADKIQSVWSIHQQSSQSNEKPQTWSFQFNVLVDDGNLQSVLLAGACDLLQQRDVHEDLWGCQVLLYESIESQKSWIVDPSFEECSNLSNNIVMVSKVGDRYAVQVGAEVNRTSFAPQNATTLNYKPSSMAIADFQSGVKLAKQMIDEGLAMMRSNSEEAAIKKMEDNEQGIQIGYQVRINQ